MEDQDKAASKPSDTTDTEEHKEAITYKLFVERDPILVVEGRGASATACGSSSTFGYEATLKGSICNDGRTDVFRISGGHCGETTSNVAKDNLNTAIECMPMEKKTESSPNQFVKINTYGGFDIEGGMVVNEGLHLRRTGSAPVMVPSTESQFHSEKIFTAQTGPVVGHKLNFQVESPTRNELLASTDVEGNKSGIGVGQFEGHRFNFQAEAPTRNELLASTDVEGNISGIGVGQFEGHRLNFQAEAPTRNELLASTDVEGNKSGIGVGQFELRSCDSSQMTWDSPTEDNGVEKTIDDASREEAERASNNSGDVACARIDNIPDTTDNIRASNDEVSKSCAYNMIFSETANEVVKIGSYGPQTFGENPTRDGEPGLAVGDASYKQAEAAFGKVRDIVASARKTSVDKTNNLGGFTAGVSNSSVSQIDLADTTNLNESGSLETEYKKAETPVDDVSGKKERVSCKDQAFSFAEKTSVNSTTLNSDNSKNFKASISPICETKVSNIINVNENILMSSGLNCQAEVSAIPAEGGHIAKGIMDNYREPTGDCAPIGNIVPSDTVLNSNLAFSDATPFANIVPSDAKVSIETQSSGNTVPDIVSFDPNTSETSKDELPLMDPGIAAAVKEGELEFHTKQDQAIQTCSENGVEEDLVKQAAIKTCSEHGREEEFANQDQPVPTCAEYDVEEDAQKQDIIKICVERDSEVEPAKQDDESKKQDNIPTNQDAVQSSLKYDGGEELVGQKIKKKFGRRNYMGEVAAFDKETSWYKVTYEDGDVEDLEWDELKPILLHLKGGDSEIRKRKKHSRLGIQRRSFKRVQRPNDSRLSRAIGCLREEMDTPVESNDWKEDEKSGLRTEDISVMDSGDKISIPTRTAKRRHSEQLTESTKKRKVEEEAHVEHDQASGSRIGNKLIKESSPSSQSNLTENRVSTRRNSGSSANNLEAISVVNADIEKFVPNFYDKAKSESHELSDQKSTPRGGGISLIGRKTRKDFGGHVYIGEVIDYDYKAQYYKVKYEDGDEEELEWTELEPTLVPSDQKPLSFRSMLRAHKMASRSTVKELSTSINENAAKLKEISFVDEGKRVLRNQQKPSSVLEEVKTGTHEKESYPRQLVITVESIGPMLSPLRPLTIARFASIGDADIHEYFSWGEVIGFEKAKCPELGAAKLLPTSSPIVHLAASQHHLAAITAAGQVWLWRSRHGNIHTRCNEWEHIACLEEKGIVLVDIAGPDLDRASGGYEANQEDQVPDPFYLVAVGADGQDFILQGSQPQEIVRTSQLSDESKHLSLRDALSQLGYSSEGNMGRIVQVSVGTVEAPDESPFIGYITDTDNVYIRSATKDYMEEVNLVSGYTGKPIKIQCGRVYHAIIMTDDGRAWTWGRGYYPGLNTFGSSGFSAATCQPAVGTLVGRKVIDVGCYGEDFIALTNDGDVHQWSHAVPNPAAGVYNVPATPLYGHGPCIPHGDKLKQVSIGAGMCAGITDSGKVHTWRTAMKGGLIGILVPEKEALTPLGHEENRKDTAIVSLGNRIATKVICVAGSLIVVVKKKAKGRLGRRRKQQTTNAKSGLEGQS